MRWAAALALVVCASIAAAHSGATGIVKERMDGMLVLGKVLKRLVEIETAGDAAENEIALLAQELQAHSGPKMLERFPEGSLQHVSEADPAIWQDWERFEAISMRLSGLAKDLEALSSDPNPDLSATLSGIRQTCADCHKDFRTKK